MAISGIMTGREETGLEIEPEQLTGEAYAVRVLDGLRGESSPAIRQHDGISIA